MRRVFVPPGDWQDKGSPVCGAPGCCESMVINHCGIPMCEAHWDVFLRLTSERQTGIHNGVRIGFMRDRRSSCVG